MQFGIISLRNENCPAIQEQDGSVLLPDRFYHGCAPGQTAQAVIASDGAWIKGPLYRAGEKDGDGPVALGKRGKSKGDAEQKRQK